MSSCNLDPYSNIFQSPSFIQFIAGFLRTSLLRAFQAKKKKEKKKSFFVGIPKSSMRSYENVWHSMGILLKLGSRGLLDFFLLWSFLEFWPFLMRKKMIKVLYSFLECFAKSDMDFKSAIVRSREFMA